MEFQRKELCIRHHLVALPEDLAERVNTERITHLDLSDNLLSFANSLPQLLDISNLHTLDLSSNALTELPLEVCGIKGLKCLTLKLNQIKSLPKDISRLHELQEFNISGNVLEQFPMALLSLTNLTILHLGGNQLQSVPQEVNRLNKYIANIIVCEILQLYV